MKVIWECKHCGSLQGASLQEPETISQYQKELQIGIIAHCCNCEEEVTINAVLKIDRD